ncbi:nuclear transport factor 2 family protein [Dysgonomonas gadei]|uniref:SnoaL-like domain-containing protein n=1 Tax=Dysgonomonas gadei ATCC BAA-286 TaxID=742766 RepID=F5J288_9BACT|nr:nuclear transport factor 2 family protein [Dysgonomonas gadei]EGK00208.1 hypothetical protein HMPREF9455_03347 [Dysgonomonas gadei ATCC BAA-286]
MDKTIIFNDYIVIQNTMAAYCRDIDTKQWESLKEIVDADAKIIFRDIDGQITNSYNRLSDLVASCVNTIQNAVTIHHLHNLEIIDIDKHKAEVVWAMEDRWYMDKNVSNEFEFFHGYGYYHVKFHYRSEKWLINSLELQRLKLEIE